MTKDKYLALADLQAIWDDTIKPWISGSFGYESKAAASGGTDESLVTTGEKYTWGQKQDALTFKTAPASNNKVITESDMPSTMGASGSSHAGGLVPDPGATAGVTRYLREDGTWTEPAGGTDTTYKININGTDQGGGTTSLGTVYAPTSAGTEGQMLTANASGIPTWGSKPSYAYSEIGYTVATQTTSGAVTVNGTTPLHIITLSGAATSVAFSTGNLPEVGHSCHIIFTASTATTVSIAHVTTGSVRYICPEGLSPSDIDVPAGGYAEIDLLRGADTEENNDTVAWIFVRGV